MALKDYTKEADYYTQGFFKHETMSIWAGLGELPSDPDLDILQDCCGVNDYDRGDTRIITFDSQPLELYRFIGEIAGATSFFKTLLPIADQKELLSGVKWVLAQNDFAYDPDKVSRKIAIDPVFIGSFSMVRGKGEHDAS